MKNVLTILFRQRKAVLIFSLAVILLPLAISYVVTEKYKSEASILLTPGRFKKPFLPNEADSRTGFVQLNMEDVASEVEILLSNPVMEKVTKDNNLYIFPEPAEDEYLKRFFVGIKKGINAVLVAVDLKKEMTDFEVALEKLKNDVDVEFLKRTNIITIEWSGHSPDQAQKVVSSIVNEYLKHHIKVHGNFEAFEVLKNQVQSDQQRVLEKEEEINRIKTEIGSFDIEKERETLTQKYLDAKSMYDNLLNIDPENVMSTSRGLYADDPNFVKLIGELTQVEMERIEKIVRFGKKNRQVSINDKQISRLKSLINREHKHNLEAWRISVKNIKSRLQGLETIRQKIKILQRELEGLIEAYSISRQKYNEALIERSMDQANIASAHIVSPASYSTTPSFPKKMLLLVISTFFAIVGGIATAFASENVNTRIVNGSDITDTCDFPVLFTIREFTKNELEDEQFVLDSLFMKFAGVSQFLSRDETVKTHLVVSPSPGSGTSFITTHLARYAQKTTNTKSLYISVDYDSTISKSFSDPPIIRKIDMDELNIKILSPQNHTSYYSLLNNIKEQGTYSNIFIDFTTQQWDDHSYLNVTQICDHIFVNVAYNLTNKFALKNLDTKITIQQSVKPTGAFLNLRRNEIPDFIYKHL